MPPDVSSTPVVEILGGGLHAAEILGRVAGFYHEALAAAPDIQERLRGRGLYHPEALRAFRVGYAAGDVIATLAPEVSEVRSALVRLGLVDETGVETLTGCVVFPLEDPRTGAVVRLAGYPLDDPAGALQTAGLEGGIWNAPGTRSAEGSDLLVVPGVLDAYAAWTADFKNVAALTPGLTDLVARHPPARVVFAGVPADDEAGVRLADLAPVFQAEIPGGVTVAGYLRDHGAKAFESLLATAQPMVMAGTSVETVRDPDRGAGVVVRRGDREYRVYDLNPYGVGKMRANVHAVRGDRLHVDTLDLFVAGPRKGFVRAAADELGLDEETVGRDVIEVIRACQKVREEAKASLRAGEPDRPRPEIADDDRREALDLLTAPDLLERIERDMTALGYVGEATNKVLGYLAAVSRKLDRPLSCVVVSRSAAGKSALLDAVAALTPPEDLHHYSDLTPQALSYMEPGALAHALLIIDERAGSAPADYSIRELQSRRVLVKGVPAKDPASGRIVTKRIEVRGPIAYLESTSTPTIPAENASRCFTLHADESEAQTRAVQAEQRRRAGPGGLALKIAAEAVVRRHHAVQRLLEPVRVVVPYASILDFPTKKLRSRRDHERFLSLIEAVAFVRQLQREKKTAVVEGQEVEYIEATVADYEAAWRLARVVLAESLDDLPRGSRQLLTTAVEIVRGRGPWETTAFGRRDLIEANGWSIDQVKAWIRPLEEHEILKTDRGKNGSAFRYRLAVPPDRVGSGVDLGTLPTPDEVRARLNGGAS